MLSIGGPLLDADILHLYKRAGAVRFLLGIESYDEAMLGTIKKGAPTSEDRQVIALLRQHGIISVATYVVGFKEETDALKDYEPPQTCVTARVRPWLGRIVPISSGTVNVVKIKC